MIENQENKLITKLRIDNSLEFYYGDFDDFCKNMGPARHHTVKNNLQ